MALTNLKSSEVTMFPSSMRSGVDVYSRFTTELNLVDIVNRVSSGKFITGTFTESGHTWIDFTLMGYHFNVDATSGFSSYSNNSDVYVAAIVGKYSTESRYDAILKGWTNNAINNSVDDDGTGSARKFIGLAFTTSEADCTNLQNSVSALQTGTFVCDYMRLGTKTSGGFTLSTDNSVVDFDTMTDADVQACWNAATA